MPAGFDENDKKTRDKCLYLKQLLADKRSMAQMPGVFNHLERLLDDGKLTYLIPLEDKKKTINILMDEKHFFFKCANFNPPSYCFSKKNYIYFGEPLSRFLMPKQSLG